MDYNLKKEKHKSHAVWIIVGVVLIIVTFSFLSGDTNNTQNTKNSTYHDNSINSEDNLVSVIKKWEKRLAFISCTFTYQDGTFYEEKGGSGTLIIGKDGEYAVATNRHVVISDFGGRLEEYGPGYCTVKIGSSTYSYNRDYVKNSPSKNDFFIKTKKKEFEKGYDYALLILKDLKEITNEGAVDYNLCSGEVPKGSKIVILGYPIIGSQVGVTATEGIISGQDGFYYITSAKIDHGNSGGAAILIKDDCYLGIPTGAVLGEIESLGRILDINPASNTDFWED